MPTPQTDSIFAKCLPVMRRDFGACAGMTLCDLSPTTPSELEDMFSDESGRWRLMSSLLDFSVMGKACGIKENGLYDWLITTAAAWGPKKLVIGSSNVKSDLLEVRPFVLDQRQNILNVNYWEGTNGVIANSTAPNGAAYNYRIDVTSPQGVPTVIDWFPERLEIHISSLSTGGSVSRSTWQVVDATQEDSDTVRLYLKDMNSASSLPVAKRTPPAGAAKGIVMLGVPNVNPHESWCAEDPRINRKQAYPIWLQDTRWSLCQDELTQRFRKHLAEDNPLYRTYIQTEEAEHNMEVYRRFQKRLVHQFFFGKPLPNQTLEQWGTLESIDSWTDGAPNYLSPKGIEARCVGRRANAVGIYEQMNECDRVYDLQGEPLNLPEFFKELYTIMRLRESNGTPHTTIEVVMESQYKEKFKRGLYRYKKAIFEDTLRAQFDVDAQSRRGRTELGFVWEEFDLDWPNVTLRLITHYAFDDILNAHKMADPNLARAGRFILVLDWTDTGLGIINTESAIHETANAKDLAKFNSDAFCTMKVPKRTVKLNSMKFGVRMGCPATSLWIEGVADEVPEHRGPSGDYTDLYGVTP